MKSHCQVYKVKCYELSCEKGQLGKPMKADQERAWLRTELRGWKRRSRRII